MYICIYIRTYKYTHTHMYIYIYVYIHTPTLPWSISPRRRSLSPVWQETCHAGPRSPKTRAERRCSICVCVRVYAFTPFWRPNDVDCSHLVQDAMGSLYFFLCLLMRNFSVCVLMMYVYIYIYVNMCAFYVCADLVPPAGSGSCAMTARCYPE